MGTSVLHWARPGWAFPVVGAYSLWLIAWIYLRFGHVHALEEADCIQVGATRALADLPRSWRWRARTLATWLRPCALGILSLALIGPQYRGRRFVPPGQGIDIMLAIDTSQSMQALDLDRQVAIAHRKTRLLVVKDVVSRFVERRHDDSLGIVVFGSEAYLQCPLTLDHDIVESLLKNVSAGMAGDSTAIGSGIAAATQRLAKSRAKSRVIILLTDGRNNAGSVSPRTAAEMAAALGIKIYTIGAGSHGRAPFIVPSPLGPQVAYDEVDIDDDALTEVAQLTNGRYYRAEDSDELAQIYDQIDALEKSEVRRPLYFDVREFFPSLLLAAFCLLLLESLALGSFLAKTP